MPSIQYTLVDTPAALADACDQLRSQSSLFADTEFMRVKTYTPQLALLQFAAKDSVLCIDPAAGLDLSPLWAVVMDPQRLKILHSGKQDYEAFYFTLGDTPKNLFDTQVAAALCGHPAQIGYAGLVEARFGATISKSQTRSDWLKRPLTTAQLSYAAEDVEYLERLYEQLRSELTTAGRLEWAIEDSEALTDASLYRPNPETAWQRIKNLQFAPPAEQARARQLATWREERSVTLDKPRSWILSDAVLREIAALNPESLKELSAVNDLPPSTLRKNGDKLLKAIDDANEAVRNGSLAPIRHERPDQEHKTLLKQLGRVVSTRAEELKVPAEILASKKELNAMILGDRHQRPLLGWRANEIGQQLLAEL
ncbi:MAG: ribonuclease D [Gammaproteobacteria bacterium]|nr:ribonuclease D [Gammaproteobacteria bacterium]